jgi:hypothetical protein
MILATKLQKPLAIRHMEVDWQTEFHQIDTPCI